MCTTDDEVCRLRNMFCKTKYIVFKIKILTEYIGSFFKKIRMLFTSTLCIALSHLMSLVSFYTFLGNDITFRCLDHAVEIS